MNWLKVSTYIVAGIGVARLGQVIINYIQYRSLKAHDWRPKVYHPGIVYLHVFPRDLARQTPNLSPFAVKVETWLRMNNIKYQLVETIVPAGRTKQIPYIRLNEREVPDSSRIIEYLTETLDLDPTDGLTEEQRGIARAFQRMVDEATSWTSFMHAYYFHVDAFSQVYRPPVAKMFKYRFQKFLKRKFGNRAWAQGIGRKTEEEISQIGQNDIRAISWYLGNKLYFMGDEPTTVDCTLFGHLSRIMYVDLPYPHKDIIEKECTNIRPYLDRMKERYWPDWDSIVTPGFFT